MLWGRAGPACCFYNVGAVRYVRRCPNAGIAAGAAERAAVTRRCARHPPAPRARAPTGSSTWLRRRGPPGARGLCSRLKGAARRCALCAPLLFSRAPLPGALAATRGAWHAQAMPACLIHGRGACPLPSGAALTVQRDRGARKRGQARGRRVQCDNDNAVDTLQHAGWAPGRCRGGGRALRSCWSAGCSRCVQCTLGLLTTLVAPLSKLPLPGLQHDGAYHSMVCGSNTTIHA